MDNVKNKLKVNHVRRNFRKSLDTNKLFHHHLGLNSQSLNSQSLNSQSLNSQSLNSQSLIHSIEF